MFNESFGSVDFQDLYIPSGCLQDLDILITNPFFPIKFMKKIRQGGAKGRWYNDPSDEKHFFLRHFSLQDWQLMPSKRSTLLRRLIRFEKISD
mgnify:CR=1 FL=1